MLWTVKQKLVEIFKRFMNLVIKSNLVSHQTNLDFDFEEEDIYLTNA